MTKKFFSETNALAYFGYDEEIFISIAGDQRNGNKCHNQPLRGATTFTLTTLIIPTLNNDCQHNISQPKTHSKIPVSKTTPSIFVTMLSIAIVKMMTLSIMSLSIMTL